MKDFIILFSTILLGLVIGGLVIGLGDTAKDMTDDIKNQMTAITSWSAITTP